MTAFKLRLKVLRSEASGCFQRAKGRQSKELSRWITIMIDNEEQQTKLKALEIQKFIHVRAASDKT